VFWPHGWQPDAAAHGVDPLALVIGAAAAIALFRFQTGVIPVILACGAAGWAAATMAR
jgi:chromate transporter